MTNSDLCVGFLTPLLYVSSDLFVSKFAVLKEIFGDTISIRMPGAASTCRELSKLQLRYHR